MIEKLQLKYFNMICTTFCKSKAERTWLHDPKRSTINLSKCLVKDGIWGHSLHHCMNIEWRRENVYNSTFMQYWKNILNGWVPDDVSWRIHEDLKFCLTLCNDSSPLAIFKQAETSWEWDVHGKETRHYTVSFCNCCHLIAGGKKSKKRFTSGQNEWNVFNIWFLVIEVSDFSHC